MKLINVEKQTDNKFVNLYKLKYELEDGSIINYELASRRSEEELSCKKHRRYDCDAVMIAPVLENGDIVMLRQFRPAVNNYIYEFPAGLVDKYETIYEAAVRELFEETGLLSMTIESIAQPSFISAGMSDERLALVKVKATGEITTEHNEADEEIQVITIKKEDIPTLLDEEEIAFNARVMLQLLAK